MTARRHGVRLVAVRTDPQTRPRFGVVWWATRYLIYAAVGALGGAFTAAMAIAFGWVPQAP